MGATTGVSALEALVVVALLGIAVAPVVPSFVSWRQRQRLDAAARHLARELVLVCAHAAASGRTHGLRLTVAGRDLIWQRVADGDGDGISAGDLSAGIDAGIAPQVSLRRRFPGIVAGRPAGVPAVSGGASGSAGLAFGNAAAVSCSAGAGARSGTLYLHDARGDAAAVRVYGPTARLTLWWWDAEASRWTRSR